MCIYLYLYLIKYCLYVSYVWASLMLRELCRYVLYCTLTNLMLNMLIIISFVILFLFTVVLFVCYVFWVFYVCKLVLNFMLCSILGSFLFILYTFYLFSIKNSCSLKSNLCWWLFSFKMLSLSGFTFCNI